MTVKIMAKKTKKTKKTRNSFISQKILKVISVFMLVMGIMLTLVGIFFLTVSLLDPVEAGEGYLKVSEKREDIAGSVLILFEGTIGIITGLLGYKAASSLPKAKLVMVIIFVMMLSSLGDFIVELIWDKSFEPDSIFNFIFYLVLYMLVSVVRKHLRGSTDSNFAELFKKNKSDKLKLLKRSGDFDDIIMWSVAFLLVFFSFITEIIGYNRFTITFLGEYSDEAYKLAITAASYLNVDEFDDYLNVTDPTLNYKQAKASLDKLCKGQEIACVDVAIPDEKYEQYTHIFYRALNIPTEKVKTIDLGEVTGPEEADYKKAYRQIYEKDRDYVIVESATDITESYPWITALIPLKNSAGEVKAVLSVKKYITELESARNEYVDWISGATLYIIILTVVVNYVIIVFYIELNY